MLSSSSPMSAKAIVFLLGLLYLQASSTEAAISTSAGFPQDLFAKPAFQVNYGRVGNHVATLPIKRGDAIKILEQQEASSSSSTSSESRSSQTSDILSLAVADRTSSGSSSQQDENRVPLHWTLQRSSPDDFQLCSIPDFTHPPPNGQSVDHRTSSFASSPRSRQELIRHAQSLLDPLKKVCLYHTTDWFTYSFCHGREIRQFRRLGPQTAAQKAFKAAGGGEAGKKAAIEAADQVNRLHHPVADPEYPAFILGRWTHQSEDIVGDDQSHQRRQQQPLTAESVEQSTDVTTSSNRGMPSINSAGLDLVEEVQFGDWDEDELFAAEARALSHFQDVSSNTAVESSPDTSTANAQESHRHRYLTQRWTNGTMCDMNHQPRTVEVQYHCSNRPPHEDRIVMFKETTICNYVLIIETPRLCADAAFGSEKEEVPFQIQCHKVVRDDYGGATVGDPERVQVPLSEIDGAAVAGRSDKDASNSVRDDLPGRVTSSSDQQGADEASSTSHTYGDPSRFTSVHDDYYDEALGDHGALYHQYHDHPHHYDDVDEAEILVEIGLDEEGHLLVNKVSDAPAEAGRRRESGKKRSDDDEEKPMEIQLDMDDFMSVLRGEEGGSLEKKVAEKIAEVLNRQMENEQDDGKGEGGEKGKVKTPEDVAKMYQRLMAAVSGNGDEAEKRKERKGSRQQSPPVMKMEKVGDSLSERAKRLYDAKKRDEKKGEGEVGGGRAPPIQEHLEL